MLFIVLVYMCMRLFLLLLLVVMKWRPTTKKQKKTELKMRRKAAKAFAPRGRTLDLATRLVSFGDPGLRLRAALSTTTSLDHVSQSGVYVDDHHLVALFDWFGPEAVVDLTDVDRIWAGEPRPDGERSLELFVAR